MVDFYLVWSEASLQRLHSDRQWSAARCICSRW